MVKTINVFLKVIFRASRTETVFMELHEVIVTVFYTAVWTKHKTSMFFR